MTSSPRAVRKGGKSNPTVEKPGKHHVCQVPGSTSTAVGPVDGTCPGYAVREWGNGGTGCLRHLHSAPTRLAEMPREGNSVLPACPGRVRMQTHCPDQESAPKSRRAGNGRHRTGLSVASSVPPPWGHHLTETVRGSEGWWNPPALPCGGRAAKNRKLGSPSHTSPSRLTA